MTLYLGDFTEDSILDFKFPTRFGTPPVPTTLAGSPALSVYKSNSTTQRTGAEIVLTPDFDGVTGLNHGRIDTSADAFYAVANDYNIVLSAGTVGGTSVVGEVVAHFSIQNRSVSADVIAAAVASAMAEIRLHHLLASDSDIVGSNPPTVGSVFHRLMSQATGSSDYSQTTDSLAALALKATDIETDTQNIQTLLPAALVGGRIDASIGAVASGAIADAGLAADLHTYQAKVWMFDDTTTDRYVAVWHKNGQPITSGITSPTIQVIQVADGADLVAATAMTQIGALGMYRYNEGTNRIVDGVAYIIKATASIDSATRTWYQPIGRDA